MGTGYLGFSWILLLSAILLQLLLLTIFVTVSVRCCHSSVALSLLNINTQTRHIQLQQRRNTCTRPEPRLNKSANLTTLAASNGYYLFVLGSGGHTKEMLMMMDDGHTDFGTLHRRYLISSGDNMSENHLEDYEADLRLLCKSKGHSPGSYDKAAVRRARKVHQPLWSTPFSALLSMLDIFRVLFSPPRAKAGRSQRYPGQILSNGPATGFFVGLVAYVLKIFYVVPEDSMRFIYIESWARISTLSLTGRLLYHTGIADLFLVQHEAVAEKFGVLNAGPMVFNSRRSAS